MLLQTPERRSVDTTWSVSAAAALHGFCMEPLSSLVHVWWAGHLPVCFIISVIVNTTLYPRVSGIYELPLNSRRPPSQPSVKKDNYYCCNVPFYHCPLVNENEWINKWMNLFGLLNILFLFYSILDPTLLLWQLQHQVTTSLAERVIATEVRSTATASSGLQFE